MNVVLVNTNRIQPPIAPIGLDYLAEALHTSGHRVEIFDPPAEADWVSSAARFFSGKEVGLLGLTFRNTDDCVFTSRQSFFPVLAEMVKDLRRLTDARMVLGGVGFSVMPERVLEFCEVDMGIWGEGEGSFPELASRMEANRDWSDLPNLVWPREGRWIRNPAAFFPLEHLPAMTRKWIDNERYFRQGGQIGFETKRGCPNSCTYCADPAAKGKVIRTRPPRAVADELEGLLSRGIDHLHTCDCEFNIPISHALEVCREIVARGLGEKLRWYAYCAPVPFSAEAALLMRRAGCAGINFGTDSGDGEMLRRLGRNFTPEDILETVRCCREAGIATMIDLLFGSPGESRGSMVRTLDLMKRANPDRVGVAVGVRVYPGTRLDGEIMAGAAREGLAGGPDAEPLFFLEPGVAPFIFRLLDEIIGDDPRFFFFDPSRPARNYNYNANQRLQEAIGKGYRGAYWDILRRYA